jgi:hypothetical protein
MRAKRRIEAGDLLSIADYAGVRKERRREIIAKKQDRRLEVGPVATFHFENYDSMWLQVQEMLYIEKGGPAQIADELAAYNPLVPRGDELVATVMFEIDEPEETAFIEVDGRTIAGEPERDVDRTSAEGKASSVQFIHFRFTPAEIAAFRKPGAKVVVGFRHPAYGHMAVMPEPMRQALAADFD